MLFAALALAVALVGCSEPAFYSGQFAPCGNHAALDPESGLCACAPGYDRCSGDGEALVCCARDPDDVGPTDDAGGDTSELDTVDLDGPVDTATDAADDTAVNDTAVDSSPDTDPDDTATDTLDDTAADPPDDTPDDTGGDAADVGGCGVVTSAGRCSATGALEYCLDGELIRVECPDPLVCGFDASTRFFNCLGSDGEPPPPDDDEECKGVPSTGWCNGYSTLVWCAAPSGGGPAELITYDCGPGYYCADTVYGSECAREVDFECETGWSYCSSGVQLEYCEDAAWTSYACTPGSCLDTALGATCTPSIVTAELSGRLYYEGRDPNESWTDWGAPAPYGARGLLVISWHGEEVVDATYTDAETEPGAFSIRIPASPTEGDVLAVYLATADDVGGVAFAVADPDLGLGEHAVGALGPDPYIRAWSLEYGIPTEYHEWVVDEANGGGAVRLFEVGREAFELAVGTRGVETPEPLVIWASEDVEWDCGACYAPYTTYDPAEFRHQIWVSVGSDATWWSDAVTAHEVGHYVMQAYGTSPGEGGEHILSIPTHPGMAWSEGWATYYSSAVRRFPVYYDKQDGGFFWLNLESRDYGTGWSWSRAERSLGLMQMMDENEVAAMLWELDDREGVDVFDMLDSLAADRMRHGPFERGYTTRTWDGLDDDGYPLPYTSTRFSAPFLADFLDELLCGARATRAQVDRVTDPSTSYPYPSASPLCR